MDESKYVELEAKYDASALPVADFRAVVGGLPDSAFKTVVGVDTFFSDTKKVLRFRRKRAGTDVGASDRPALTYKCRRRVGDISDRTEIDMWLGDKATDQDVRAMMEVMGMTESFSIVKESWIYHVPDTETPDALTYGRRMQGDGIDVVFALYDVLHMGQIHRFLEVEIERKGTIAAEWAASRLIAWKEWVAQNFPTVGHPLNQSLYEMFAPRDRLFIPESF